MSTRMTINGSAKISVRAGLCFLAGLMMPLSVTAQDADTQQADETETKELTASELNARQRITQTVTVKRTVNGTVVEEKRVEVPNPAGLSRQPTEAGMTRRQLLSEQLDRQALTRAEAAEEANLEFTLADQDRDGLVSQSEYEALATVRREDPAYQQFTVLTSKGGATERIDGTLSAIPTYINEFSQMAGANSQVERRDYVRAYIVLFDQQDKDENSVLLATELENFRRSLIGLASGVSDE